MEPLSGPDPPHDRIARAAARVNAAMARVSQAQETLIEAKERLARAPLALKHTRSRDPDESPTDKDLIKVTDTS